MISDDYVNNTDYQILTDDGWKDFKGIKKYDHRQLVSITTESGKNIKVSKNHLFFSENDGEIEASECLNFKIKTEDGYEIVISVDDAGVDSVYDVVDVDGVYSYYGNGFLNHNTHLMEEFWKSVYPTISRSRTSKIVAASTPNGVGNLFHKLYTEAEKNLNGFVAQRIEWNEIPGRDDEWKEKQIKALGSYEAFLQEFGNSFLDNSQQSIDEALFDRLKNECRPPLHILKDGAYKIWEEYDPEKIYVIGGDVSEGVGLDASVLQVLDITNPKEIIQVAEYWTNKKGPAEFTNEVVDVCGHWGNPLLLIERNNQGSGVCDTLANTHMYQNLVSWGAKEAHKNKQNGMISHINTKYKAVENQRYFVNEVQSVTFRNLDTLKEFKNFVRYPNGSWKAKSGEHDDRVMAFVWALMALYKDITELYFEIEELDDCDKPLVIKPIDTGLYQYRSATSIYTNEEVAKIENSNLAPMLFGGSGSMAASDMAELEAQGWYIPEGSIYSNSDRNIKSDQWDAMERYFG